MIIRKAFFTISIISLLLLSGCSIPSHYSLVTKEDYDNYIIYSTDSATILLNTRNGSTWRNTSCKYTKEMPKTTEEALKYKFYNQPNCWQKMGFLEN